MKNLFLLILCTFGFNLHAQDVKIMTYNIRYDNVDDGPNHWPKRMEKVFALIKKYDPDIIGVQEALLGQLNDLTKNLPAYTFVGIGRDDGKQKGEYSAILYKRDKFTIHDQNTFWLSESPEVPGSKDWDAAITRVATWAEMEDKTTGNRFLMINTHFDHVGKTAREKSAVLLKDKAASLAKGLLPVVISGDFNCEPASPPYKRMTAEAGLKLLDSRPQSSTQGTYCSFEVGSQECRIIDYIFYSEGWKSKDYKVITDNDGKYYPSDHLPVIVTLQKN